MVFFHLLDAIYSQTSPVGVRQLPALEVLRQLWLQQYYAPTDRIQLRSDKDGPPSAVRIRSPYDLDARNSTKRTSPCITREGSEFLASHQGENEPQPSITQQRGFPLTFDTERERQSVALPTIRELEVLHDRVLSQLKLGKQATGYKTAQKVLNRFIAELIGSV